VRQDCIEPLGLTITEAAKALGVTRQALNNLVNGKAGLSPEMAVRLSKAFGASPEMWLRLQSNYDLAQVRQDAIAVKRYRRAS
jgi:addiction module HigA family antidote